MMKKSYYVSLIGALLLSACATSDSVNNMEQMLAENNKTDTMAKAEPSAEQFPENCQAYFQQATLCIDSLGAASEQFKEALDQQKSKLLSIKDKTAMTNACKQASDSFMISAKAMGCFSGNIAVKVDKTNVSDTRQEPAVTTAVPSSKQLPESCETYLRQVKACANKMGAAGRPFEAELDNSRERWMALPDKVALSQACQQASEAFQASAKEMGCSSGNNAATDTTKKKNISNAGKESGVAKAVPSSKKFPANCEMYFRQVKTCVNKMGAAGRQFEATFNASKAQWLEMSDSEALSQACKQASTSFAASAKAMGC